MRATFITSTPLNVERGSGTFVGIETLTRSLRNMGWTIDAITPRLHLPIYTLERIVFNELLRNESLGNESLRFQPAPNQSDLSVGFDLDGYALPRSLRAKPHIASIKGVIADELQFEKGLTRTTMQIQSRLEALHLKRAQFIITTSRYSAARLKELYGVTKVDAIIPEMIDLRQWDQAMAQCKPQPDRDKFTVLSVARFYPRKRLELLLYATHILQSRIPNLEIHLVGGGPETQRLRRLCKTLSLTNVTFRENISQADLVREYCSCDVFCLPSIQEGFGIVFLEAMASAKPIIAARAAAVPEVVKHGILTDPESVNDIATAISDLYANPSLRADLGQAGKEFVKNFDSPVVAGLFAAHAAEMLRSY